LSDGVPALTDFSNIGRLTILPTSIEHNKDTHGPVAQSCKKHVYMHCRDHYFDYDGMMREGFAVTRRLP